MAKVRGSFYFKSSVNGNLLGEFTNDHSKDVIPESAILIEDPGMATVFVGEYLSVWFDIELKQMNLSIRESEEGIKYVVEWSEEGTLVYRGEGFLVDEMLIGHYVQV